MPAARRSLVLYGTALLALVTLATTAFASGLDVRVGNLDVNLPLGGVGALDGTGLNVPLPGDLPDVGTGYQSGPDAVPDALPDAASALAPTSTAAASEGSSSAATPPANDAPGWVTLFPDDTRGFWLLVLIAAIALIAIGLVAAAVGRRRRHARARREAERAVARAGVRPGPRTRQVRFTVENREPVPASIRPLPKAAPARAKAVA
jgi:hypothetical protein